MFFLVSLLKSITAAHDSPNGCLRWRCDEDINHDHYTRTVEQLRGPPIAIPTSNSRPRLQQGDKVEVLDASEQWRWAKITACHEDGTFNVRVYDDSGVDGQQWNNVAPVYLRSRILQVKPKGIAIRSKSEIPRWGGDDGVAFMAALAAYDNTDTEIESKHSDSNKKRRLGYWEEKDPYESDHSSLDFELESKSSDIVEEVNVRHPHEEGHVDSTKAQRRKKARSRFSTKKQNTKIRDSNSKPMRNRTVKNRKKAARLGKKTGNKRSKFKSRLQLDTELSSSNGKSAATRRSHNLSRSGRTTGRKRPKNKAQLSLNAKGSTSNQLSANGSTTSPSPHRQSTTSPSQNSKITHASHSKLTHASRAIEHSHASMCPSDSDDWLDSKLNDMSGQKNSYSDAEYSPNNVRDDDMETKVQTGDDAFRNSKVQTGDDAFRNPAASKSDALPPPRAVIRMSLSGSGSFGAMTIKERQRASQKMREKQRASLKIRGNHRVSVYSTQSLASASMPPPRRQSLHKAQSAASLTKQPRRRPLMTKSRSLASASMPPPKRVHMQKSSSSPCTFTKSEYVRSPKL